MKRAYSPSKMLLIPPSNLDGSPLSLAKTYSPPLSDSEERYHYRVAISSLVDAYPACGGMPILMRNRN